MPVITVIDAPCGEGKTSWAIQHINENPGTKFIFITPLLDEVKRIEACCHGFIEPSDSSGSKMSHFKRLLKGNHNIVSTHSLFSNADDEVLDLLQAGQYTLILDEVMEVVRQETISRHDIENLESGGWVSIEKETGAVSAVDQPQDYKGNFTEIIEKAKAGRLIYSNGSFLIWEFPPEIFMAMQNVLVLTYLFPGQMMRCYFDAKELPYETFSVGRGEQEGEYRLALYFPGDADFRRFARDTINIYEGRLNAVGDTGLSYSWYGKNDRSTRKQKETLRKNTYNFFRHQVRGTAAENMWTCFKHAQDTLKGKGYASGFVQCGVRATNDYRHKSNLAYLINRYPQTGLISYFESNGVKVKQNLFALSELIQWVWRSRIRDGKPINLYLPSRRMREDIFKPWLQGERI